VIPAGTASFSSSSLFPPNSGPRMLNPVAFPPGRAKVSMMPLATGFPNSSENDGNSPSRVLCDQNIWSRRGTDDIHLDTDKLFRQLSKPIKIPFCISVLDQDVLSFKRSQGCAALAGMIPSDLRRMIGREQRETLSLELSSPAALRLDD
jgi:hypothetical protein